MIKDIWENNKRFVFFVILLFAIRWSIIDHYRVPTSSMYPSVFVGDQLLVNKMSYDFKIPYTSFVLFKLGDPEPGDIVVFEYPRDRSINYVKRLIARPGDTFEVDNGFVKVNGESLLLDPKMKESLIKELMSAQDEFRYKEKNGNHEYQINRTPSMVNTFSYSATIPENSYFVMGDNRDQSSDGRVWGYVPRDHFKGRAMRVILSVTMKDFIKWERTGMKLD